MRAAWALLVLVGCARGNAEPARAVGDLPWCVTRGEVAVVDGVGRIAAPVFRAVAPGTAGDQAALDFTYDGPTDTAVPLASGQLRRQLGLKLRAADCCNLIYVMWRIEPRAELVVSVKRNPGAHDHRGCGAGGYTDLTAIPAPLAPGAHHALAARIDGETLSVEVDGEPRWRGPLPATVRDLRGPAGLRSDNVRWQARLTAAPGATAGPCRDGD